MQPYSTSSESDSGLPYPLPSELALVGKYVSSRAHLRVLPTLDTHELAWAAGFFDGEGCTSLGRHGPRRFPAPCSEVNQIHPYVLDRFRSAVGEIGTVRKRPDSQNKRQSPMWSYTTRNWRNTQALLTLLWPFLSVVKREQAAVVYATYQRAVKESPNLGRPGTASAWTATTCPRGHTDIYVRVDALGNRWRRCRICRAAGTQLAYRDVAGQSEQAVGERNGSAKLSASIVRSIRARYAAGTPQVMIAREHDVSPQQVHMIVHRKTWRHVAD